jgi:hypothetical protein
MVGSENHRINADVAKMPFKCPKGRLRKTLLVKQKDSTFDNAISYSPPNLLQSYHNILHLFLSHNSQTGTYAT